MTGSNDGAAQNYGRDKHMPHDERYDIADEPMVGMAGAAFGTEGEDRGGLHRVDDRGQPRAQLAQDVERREAAVGETDDVELLHAESIRGAGRFLGARRGELGAGGDVREVGDALGPVGGDDEVRFAALAREAGEERSDDALVVGVSEDGHDGAARGLVPLRVRRDREERGECRSGECRERDAHAIL